MTQYFTIFTVILELQEMPRHHTCTYLYMMSTRTYCAQTHLWEWIFEALLGGTCSLEINRFVPVSQNQNLNFLCSLFPKTAFVPLFTSFLDLSSLVRRNVQHSSKITTMKMYTIMFSRLCSNVLSSCALGISWLIKDKHMAHFTF